MKKIYFLLCTVLIASSSFAQADLEVIHSVQTNDTFTIQSVNPPQYVFGYGFVNHGPNALTQTDTIFLRSPYQTIKLLLPSAGLPVNDTVYYFDTTGFNSGTVQGSFNWCDSIWAKNSSNAIIPDPVIANNKTCHLVWINNTTLGIGNSPIGSSKSSVIGAITVYPNPATNKISFDFYSGSVKDASVRVTDLMGRNVFVKEYGSVYGDQKIDIDVNGLSNGVYFVELKLGETKQLGRFVIQK